MIARTKSKSGWEAEGKPTSISLKPISTSWANIDVLALEVHRVDEGLVAVAQVHAAPARRLGQSAIGPRAVGQVDGHRRAVLGKGHGTGLLGSHPACPSFRREPERNKKAPADAGARASSARPVTAAVRSGDCVTTYSFYRTRAKCPGARDANLESRGPPQDTVQAASSSSWWPRPSPASCSVHQASEGRATASPSKSGRRCPATPRRNVAPRTQPRSRPWQRWSIDDSDAPASRSASCPLAAGSPSPTRTRSRPPSRRPSASPPPRTPASTSSTTPRRTAAASPSASWAPRFESSAGSATTTSCRPSSSGDSTQVPNMRNTLNRKYLTPGDRGLARALRPRLRRPRLLPPAPTRTRLSRRRSGR